jgi:hypothetical protein
LHGLSDIVVPAALCSNGCMHGACAGDIDFWFGSPWFPHVTREAVTVVTHTCFYLCLWLALLFVSLVAAIVFSGPQHLLSRFVSPHFVMLVDAHDNPCVPQDGLAAAATPPFAEVGAIPLAATATCPASVFAHWATRAKTAAHVRSCIASVFGCTTLICIFVHRGAYFDHACVVCSRGSHGIPKCISVSQPVVQHRLQEF